jgi:hypothetical protein
MLRGEKHQMWINIIKNKHSQHKYFVKIFRALIWWSVNGKISVGVDVQNGQGAKFQIRICHL